jgi:hypothetical protein
VKEALRVEEEVHEVGACLFTGEDRIGGVVVEPFFPCSSKARAVIEDVGV